MLLRAPLLCPSLSTPELVTNLSAGRTIALTLDSLEGSKPVVFITLLDSPEYHSSPMHTPVSYQQYGRSRAAPVSSFQPHSDSTSSTTPSYGRGLSLCFRSGRHECGMSFARHSTPAVKRLLDEMVDLFVRVQRRSIKLDRDLKEMPVVSFSRFCSNILSRSIESQLDET